MSLINGCYAIIAAGGSGSRMGFGKPKQYIELMGKPIIAYTIEAFEGCAAIDGIIIVVPEGSEEVCRQIAERFSFRKILRIVAGGADRQASVYNGLLTVPADACRILVHDAVRPFVGNSEIEDVINASAESGCAILAVPVKDTIKVVDGGMAINTPDRNKLYAAQTPQCFSYRLLMRCYEEARERGIVCSDDAQLAESFGIKPKISAGSYLNFKITTPEDLLLAELIITRKGLINDELVQKLENEGKAADFI